MLNGRKKTGVGMLAGTERVRMLGLTVGGTDPDSLTHPLQPKPVQSNGRT